MSSNEMNPIMTSDELNDYFRNFLAAIARVVKSIPGFRLSETDDLQQACAEWLLRRPQLMTNYKPQALAAVVTRQRMVDHFRKMNRQLPLGAYDKNCAPEHRKVMVHFEQILDRETGVYDYTTELASTVNVEDEVENQMLLASLLQQITPRQQQVYLLVDVQGSTVVRAAKELGLKREMAQRELGAARKIIAIARQQFFADDELDESDC